VSAGTRPLAGHTALVTGGGRGIGEAVALALGREGADVVVSARTHAEIDAVAARIAEMDVSAYAIACDVTDETSVESLRDATHADAGPVSILVNNAGVASSAPLAKVTLEEWNRLMAVNATGTFLCTRAFLPDMLERGRGRVINVASLSGLVGAPYVTAYTATKHAVVGFTRALAMEVAKKGVTVNAVCPGYVETPMTDHTIRNIQQKTGRSADDARGFIESLSGHGRLVTPEEVASAVAWLAGDGAASVNGETIAIDGGNPRA